MGKIVYREFFGNRLALLFLALSVIGIPLAVIYILENTITVEESVDAPGEYLAANRKKLQKPWWWF